jgi:catalase
MPETTVIAQIVETMRTLAGPHPGFRPVHAKGLVCEGRFHPTPDAKRVSTAAHLQDAAVPATIRFANSSGNPAVADGAPGVRSMAVKFTLPNGKQTDILANSVEGFVASTPEQLLEFLRAQLPDPATGKPDPQAVPRYLGTHPAAAGFVQRMMQKAIPASYGQAVYHAEHAFRFSAADGSSVHGRYHFVPEAGEAYLSPEDGGNRAANFLRDELEVRLKQGPVGFLLELQLADANDPTDDPTALWPAERRRLELGRLEVTSVSPSSPADERRLIFDPNNLTPGIEASTDPILAARSAAYAISYDQRSKSA